MRRTGFQSLADRSREGAKVARSAGRAGLVALLMAQAACSGLGQAGVTPPDVVLVVVDALRADRAPPAVAGPPSLGALAGESTVYERATAPATWCVPVLGSLFTGRWPSYHGAERDPDDPTGQPGPIDPAAPTLAELLRSNGLRTGAFASTASPVAGGHGLERGFDELVVLPEPARAGAVVAAARRWLEGVDGRVFLFLHLDDLRPAPAAVAGEPHGDRADVAIRFAGDGGMTGERRALLAADYGRRLGEVDRAIGELLAALRETGRYDGALVVVTGDHGELLGEHGLAGHGWPPFEPIVRVPLLVKHPKGAFAGERVARRVSTMGVFATVLRSVGSPLPDRVQARPLGDLHPVWVEDVDRSGHRARAGYDGELLKVVALNDGRRRVECLYDLGRDPDEVAADCAPGGKEPLHVALRSFSAGTRPAWPARGRVAAAVPHDEDATLATTR